MITEAVLRIAPPELVAKLFVKLTVELLKLILEAVSYIAPPLAVVFLIKLIDELLKLIVEAKAYIAPPEVVAELLEKFTLELVKLIVD